MQDIQKCKSPVRVQNFRSSFSYGKEDVIIMKQTNITPIAATTDFVYSDELDSVSLGTNIANLSNIAPEQLVCLKANVAEISSVKSITTQYGKTLRKQEVFLTDPMGSIKLILWENHVNTLESNKTYKLQNLRLKYSKGERYLNTAKSEEFHYEQTPMFEGKLAVVDHGIGDLSASKICGEIIGVHSASKNLSCVSCSKKVKAKSEKIGNCENCKLMQKLDSCSSQWYLRVLVQNKDLKSQKVRLSMFNQCVKKLCKYLGSHVNVNTISEEEIVFFILESGKSFNITYDNVDNKMTDIEDDEEEEDTTGVEVGSEIISD